MNLKNVIRFSLVNSKDLHFLEGTRFWLPVLGRRVSESFLVKTSP